MYLAYLRVSSDDQSLARQHKLIENWSVKNNIAEDDLKIFEEKVSGKILKTDQSCKSLFLSYVNEIRLLFLVLID